MGTKLKTSVSSTLEEIRKDVETRKLAIVEEVKKQSSKELSELPEALTKFEKINYITKIQPHLDSIYRLTSTGFTKAKVAETLGVSTVTFRKMCKLIPELMTVVELGIEELDDNVEASLYQLAQGYEVEEEIINPFDGTKEKLTRYKDPVLGAQKYILSNKRGEKFADKKQVIRRIELGDDIKDALMSFKIEDLQKVLQVSSNKDDAIDTSYEVRYEDDQDGEED